MQQDLVSELENERTNRVIAQQTANQERLQARASAAESASLRRQLNELNQQMEQEKRTAAAARLQAQLTQPPRVSGKHSAMSPPVLDCLPAFSAWTYRIDAQASSEFCQLCHAMLMTVPNNLWGMPYSCSATSKPMWLMSSQLP